MPMSNYDPQFSKTLVEVCELTYVQYQNGPPPGNGGKITPPPGYIQTASFTAPELDFSKDLERFASIDSNNVGPHLIQDLEQLAAGIQRVYFGFSLTSSNNNIIALRGTQSIFEWIMDATIPQVPVPLVWYLHGKFEAAKVHLGFLILFSFLAKQILDAAQQFDPKLPCYVTGHSLGAALAVLTCVPVKFLANIDTVRMVNYAGPRVGNPAFADAYDSFIPESFRVVNLADIVPILPPTKILKWEYSHVGQEWSFLNQSGDVGGNHGIIAENNYTDAVDQEVPTDAPRSYPVTGL